MSGLTPRFGLSYFGGAVDGSINDDGQKFSLGDRLLIDRLFQAIEQHDYTYTATESVEPTDTPTLALTVDEGGTLPAGETYYYAVSMLDANGLETRIGPEVSISTPEALPTPLAPSGEAALGGTLPTGLYYYAITGLRDGEESPLSSPVTITLLSGDGTAELGLPPLGDADSYQVWRMAATESGYSRVGTTMTDAFTDNGSVPSNPCPTDPGNQPPQFNLGISRYGVEVTLGVDDAALVTSGRVSRWRVYRSTESQNYGNTSLVHEVIEREDEQDVSSDLLTVWTDVGDALVSGRPSIISQGINLKPFSFPTASVLPPTTGYPSYYPLVVDGVLYAKVGTVWTPLGGGGGGAVETGNLLQTGVEVLDTTGHPWYLSVTTAGAMEIIDAEPPVPPSATYIGQTKQGATLGGGRSVAQPFQVPSQTTISGLRLFVSGSTAGKTVSVSIASAVGSVGSPPAVTSLSSVEVLDLSTIIAGPIEVSFDAPVVLEVGTVYYVSVAGTATASVNNFVAPAEPAELTGGVTLPSVLLFEPNSGSPTNWVASTGFVLAFEVAATLIGPVEFYDDFVRADETPVGSPYLLAYATGVPKPPLVSNALFHDFATGNNKGFVVDSGSDTGFIEATIDASGNTDCAVNMLGRWDTSTESGLYFQVGANGWFLYDNNSTLLNSGPEGINGVTERAFFYVKLEYADTTYSVSIDGSVVGTGSHAVPSATTHGLVTFGSSGSIKVLAFYQSPSTATL